MYVPKDQLGALWPCFTLSCLCFCFSFEDQTVGQYKIFYKLLLVREIPRDSEVMDLRKESTVTTFLDQHNSLLHFKSARAHSSRNQYGESRKGHEV